MTPCAFDINQEVFFECSLHLGASSYRLKPLASDPHPSPAPPRGGLGFSEALSHLACCSDRTQQFIGGSVYSVPLSNSLPLFKASNSVSLGKSPSGHLCMGISKSLLLVPHSPHPEACIALRGLWTLDIRTGSNGSPLPCAAFEHWKHSWSKSKCPRLIVKNQDPTSQK